MEMRRFVMKQSYVTVTCNRCGLVAQAEPNPYAPSLNMGICSVRVKPNQRCGGTLLATTPGIPAAKVKRPLPVSDATEEDARELEAGLDQLAQDIGRES